MEKATVATTARSSPSAFVKDAMIFFIAIDVHAANLSHKRCWDRSKCHHIATKKTFAAEARFSVTLTITRIAL